ncbi:hypothetical membrane protein [Pelotomaculum thermopropionicum SI]|uniref:Hypothetical membrane protein n=1 Tax=Pelotomaculum thermopropionicum (strain DSM 13744 / JCM 10971 / SI) TaxID=370438 RepID=A5D5P5_PELTS|nr:hypothetical membrane protein [Pelotomaculum thermopropionicum SI]
MSMTHYMELLATNQPWNLIIYMAIPVILAETLVATEFFVVYTHQATGKLRTFNKWIGIILGFYFLDILRCKLSSCGKGVFYIAETQKLT